MLKLNVGFNRKVGEANYGSRGANVNLDLELDSGLIDQPERLKERVRQLFVLAKASVDEELNGQLADQNGHGAAANGNGHTPTRQRDATRKATASQVRAIHAIADRQQIELAPLLQKLYGLTQAAELTITEASALIDELKNQAHDHGAGGHG